MRSDQTALTLKLNNVYLLTHSRGVDRGAALLST